MDNIELEAADHVGRILCKDESRFRPRNRMAGNLWLQRFVAEPLANDMKLVPALDECRNELPTPLAPSAALRIQIVED
jgi:hypothetical protein